MQNGRARASPPFSPELAAPLCPPLPSGRQSSQLLPRSISATLLAAPSPICLCRPPATGHSLPNHSSPPTSSASPLFAAPIPTILCPISSSKISGSTGYLSSFSYKIRASQNIIFKLLPSLYSQHRCESIFVFAELHGQPWMRDLEKELA